LKCPLKKHCLIITAALNLVVALSISHYTKETKTDMKRLLFNK